jgi:hypothetical protein
MSVEGALGTGRSFLPDALLELPQKPAGLPLRQLLQGLASLRLEADPVYIGESLGQMK